MTAREPTHTPTVGYVGLNHHHTEPYLATLAELPVSVTAACEPDEHFDVDGVSGLGDVPVYTDPVELLDEEDPDIVWISLSNRDTPAVIEAAVDRGIDVYTEKPAARTAAELEELLESIDDSDATVGVSYTWRGHPAAQELRNRAATGFFGDVRSVDARFIASQLAYREADHYLFEQAASRGGIVQWLGIHWIDLLPWILADDVVRVNASLTHGTPAVDVEDGAVVQFELASGAIGSLQCGYYLREGRYDTELSITGMDGRVSWDPMGDYFGFDDETTVELESCRDEYASAPRRYLTYDYEPTPGYGGGYGLDFMQQFLDARVSADVRVPADLEDALTVLRVLDAVYESAETGEWVAVEGLEGETELKP
ncbi:Gfo/Idh/MocA family oxidoreductase [Halobacteria archaeon AArc-m2/3/4]|uniref:Gfo/Idh/MocA family oxidoreductase n=1 Tax=Natronoglomus mannanivorans TaxID=2979990 RepID=A0AAP3E3I2_9EURY|nr:Gfo/Idh/MocA family oxidoreductase [Halobacteria archaeon AArc-xg1-1]MCU4973822.1 Gfo/Idh/MocA family oxidoreductase [Halobacteria archaeon AArc-m2/3/4]